MIPKLSYRPHDRHPHYVDARLGTFVVLVIAELWYDKLRIIYTLLMMIMMNM